MYTYHLFLNTFQDTHLLVLGMAFFDIFTYEITFVGILWVANEILKATVEANHLAC